MPNLILIIIIAAVAVSLLAIRTNAALVFLALVAGNVILQFANKNMAYVNGHIDTKILPHQFTITKPSVELAVLLIPPVLVAALLKHNQGITKWPMQVFPAVATGVVGVLLVVPLLSQSLQNSITQNKLWSLLEQYQIPLVTLGVAISLVVIVFESYSSHHSSKHHH